MSSVAALLLADGRFPAGGHAHSGGMEEAVGAGRVRDLITLASFLQGRLTTSGRVAAAMAAAAAEPSWELERLDAEVDARLPSPALRDASRRQGRQLMRAAEAAGLFDPLWVGRHGSRLQNDRLHHAVALGVVAAAAGLGCLDAARWAAYDAVMTPASAAVRLMGLDPYSVTGLVARLGPEIEETAREATAAAVASCGDGAGLPCAASPLLEVAAEAHREREARLFAS